MIKCSCQYVFGAVCEVKRCYRMTKAYADTELGIIGFISRQQTEDGWIFEPMVLCPDHGRHDEEHEHMDPRTAHILKTMLIERAVDTSREFILASGRKSNFYFDARKVSLSPAGQVLLGAAFYQSLQSVLIQEGTDLPEAVGGLEVGSIPIATAIAAFSTQAVKQLDAFYVRKEPKGHGTGKLVEGLDHLSKGSEVAVVEDVTTTGGSALRAVKALREADYVVNAVFSLVDREEGGRENIEAEGLKLYPLFVKSDLLPG